MLPLVVVVSALLGWGAGMAVPAMGGTPLVPRLPSRIHSGHSGDARVQAPPAVHQVKRGDTLWELARRYHTTVEELAAANALADPHRLREGQILTIPVQGTNHQAVITESPPVAPAFRWPLAVKGELTSPYGPRWGRMHLGIDIAAPYGSPIVAAAPGIVEEAQWKGGYGRMVQIRHPGGWRTLYAHAATLAVEPGQQVAAGQVIATVGSTGHSTGPHLHFEVHNRSEPVDPLPLLPF